MKKLKFEKNNVKSIDILEKISFNKLNYLSLGDDTLGEKVEVLKKIKFGLERKYSRNCELFRRKKYHV